MEIARPIHAGVLLKDRAVAMSQSSEGDGRSRSWARTLAFSRERASVRAELVLKYQTQACKSSRVSMHSRHGGQHPAAEKSNQSTAERSLSLSCCSVAPYVVHTPINSKA